MSLFFVSRPVLDLRRNPCEVSQDLSRDLCRETQLLYGESIRILSTENGWLRVYSPLQNYEGWVRQEEVTPMDHPYHPTHILTLPAARLERKQLTLSYGTLLEQLPDGQVRLPDQSLDQIDGLRPLTSCWEQWEDELSCFLGSPYLWGGCSSPAAHHPGGVDCSGLVHLALRSQAIFIARDAKDQAMQGIAVSSAQRGDALYLFHPGKPSHHTLLALDHARWLEAPQTNERVRVLHSGKDMRQQGDWFHIDGRDPIMGTIRRFTTSITAIGGEKSGLVV